MKSRRSWPRMVEMALMASCIFTLMMRTMPSAASSTLMPSGFATAFSSASREACASSAILPPRKLPGLR